MELIYIMMPIIIIGYFVVFILLPRYGPHYKSKLVCPKCKRVFNYHWVPGASLTALRYGNRRRLKCPYCSHVNIYDVASTRVREAKVKQKA